MLGITVVAVLIGTGAISATNVDAPKSNSIVANVEEQQLYLSSRIGIEYPNGTLQELVRYNSILYGANPICLEAIIKAESGFENKCNAQYGCDSGIGLAQLIPSTAKHCSDKLGRSINPYNDKDNIECAAWLLANEGSGHWGTENTWWGSWNVWHNSCNQ